MDNIAKKFGINVAQLRNVNGLSHTKKVRSAQTMLVPANYKDNPDQQSVNSLILAESNNEAELEQNSINNESNQKSEPKLSTPLIHKVKRGDTLHALANKYDVNSKTIMKINGLKNNHLKLGQIIKLSNTNVAVGKTKHSNVKKMTVKHRIKSKKNRSRNIKTRSNIRIR
jgi:membrane-bound lytic murein transglycosylase D